MKTEKIKIHLLVDGQLQVYEVVKTISRYEDEFELAIFTLSLNIEGVEYLSNRNRDNMEFAVIDLQRQLPPTVQIICCQSCKYGNFCPYGDMENEIFCLFGFTPQNKMDVVDIFHSRNYMGPIDNMVARRWFPVNEMLHYCDKYDKIDDDNYYTYNDWEYWFRDKKQQG